ncbi:MAG: hypothetical protein M1508_14760 [Nitrospirae bacterium]|nr:hypothetical protein [Nitrospirota bacterium]MCL5422267.1 hypothetical protein [Nitrospirota bacterium]
MNFSEITSSVMSFFKDNPISAVAVGLLLLFLLVRKTKLFLVILLLAFILAAALYLITDIASVGKAGKGKIIQKGVQP